MAKTTIEFNEVAANELERLAKDLGAASKAEVIRNALALYSFILTQLSEGNLAIVKDSQIKTVIAVPGVPSFAVAAPQQQFAVNTG